MPVLRCNRLVRPVCDGFSLWLLQYGTTKRKEGHQGPRITMTTTSWHARSIKRCECSVLLTTTPELLQVPYMCMCICSPARSLASRALILHTLPQPIAHCHAAYAATSYLQTGVYGTCGGTLLHLSPAFQHAGRGGRPYTCCALYTAV